MRRILVAVVLGTVATLATAGPAAACGFLVAPNGAVNLVRTTTLAAYADGNEHYITSFEFAGRPISFGSIIPLPGAPTTVERGGDWTLQRLLREVQPPPAFEGLAASATTAAGATVAVLIRTKIESLDIAVVKGGADEVLTWAGDNGFALPGDTIDVLRHYAARSPYFMVAKFDAAEAVAQGFRGGDGIPIHLTIPVDNPWVPLRILGAAKEPEDIVAADVFLLTDKEPLLLSSPGPVLARSEPARSLLLDDLRSDKGMDWVPEKAWLSHITIDAPVSTMVGDLAVDATGRSRPSVDATGVAATVAVPPASPSDGTWTWRVVGGLTAAGLAVLAATLVFVRTRGVAAPR